jgi:hypothetical protein
MAHPARRQEQLICPLHVSQKGKSRDKYGDEYRFSDQFKALAQRLSVPIVILHHTNQKGKE